MPTKLAIEVFIDNPRSATFQSPADSVQPLLAFLQSLDGITTPTQYVSATYSQLMPGSLPLRQEVALHTQEQAKAVGHILFGWAALNILKRVEVRSVNHRVTITHETLDLEALMLQLLE